MKRKKKCDHCGSYLGKSGEKGVRWIETRKVWQVHANGSYVATFPEHELEKAKERAKNERKPSV